MFARELAAGQRVSTTEAVAYSARRWLWVSESRGGAPGARRWIALAEAAALLVLGLVFAHAHASEGGVESSLLALACILAPAHLGRLLALGGEIEPAPLWLHALELATLAGGFRRPVPPWALGIALFAVQAQALESSPARGREASARARAGWAASLTAVLATGLALALGVARDRPEALERLLLFVPVALEALSPRADRTLAGSWGRAARIGALAGLAWLGGDAVLPGSLLVAALSGIELLARAAPATSAPAEPPRRFEELDSVRGLAALTVVVHHHLIAVPVLESRPVCVAGSPGLTALKAAPLHALWAGHAAVVLFFVHSGFVLSLPFLKPRWPDVGGFLLKRICRIYVPYAAAVALAVAAFVLVPRADLPWLSGWFHNAGRGPLDAANLAGHALLVADFDNGRFDPVLWSLVHEMRVSLVFPGLMLLVTATRSRTSLLAGLGAFLVGEASQRVLGDRGVRSDLPLTLELLYMFVVGALVARHRAAIVAWLRARSRLFRGALFLAALHLYTWEFLPFEAPWLHDGGRDDLAIALGSATLLALALASGSLSGTLRSRPLVFLGRISYSLYLVHAIVELALLNGLGDRLPLGATFAISVTAAFALSVVAWRFVEEPSIALGRRLAAWREAAREARVVEADVGTRASS